MINRNESQIVARIEELIGDIALNFGQICDLLVELKSHYLHTDAFFRWYREVSAGKLHPALVMAMGKITAKVECMVGRPREVQIALVKGGPMDFCRILKGEVVTVRAAWDKMTISEFRLMFPAGGPVRSITEQRELLVQKLASGPITHIRRLPVARVDAQARTFKLGHQTVPLSVVLLALREAGITSTEAVQAA